MMITLIAVFIASSTTFTVAHAQTEIQQRHDTNNSPNGLILIAIGTAIEAIHLLIPSTSIQVIGSGTTFQV